MSKISRLALVFAILIACTACDQATKSIAQKSLAFAPPFSLLGDLVRFEYIENRGATLGFGASLPVAFWVTVLAILVSVVFVATLVFALKPRAPEPALLIGLSLVTAGGLGNLLDRLFNHGQVIDFVSFGFGWLRTGIMNLADIAIFAGAGVFLFFSARKHSRNPTAPTRLENP